MSKNSTSDPSLWDAAKADPGHPDSRAPERRMLPHDLDVALKYLSEGELARLREAVAFETRRRSLASAGKGIETPVRPTQDKPALAAGGGLTTSQINLIRSSIKAGVKPTVLARQFGLSRAQIQAALSGS